MNFITLLFSGILLQTLSGLAAPIIKPDRKYNAVSHTLAISGLLLSLTASVMSFLYPSYSNMVLFYHHYWGEVSLRIDSAAMFFLFVIQAAAIPSVIYSYSYQKHYIESGKNVKAFVSCFLLLVASLQLLVLADHSILFLLLWEAMAVLSFLNMTFESEKAEVRKGSALYFAATHLATLLLYCLFITLHSATGSWNFSDFHVSLQNPWLYYPVFVMGFIGFGLKAGFMPFHFWLPKAHPVAPTYLSAFLSGVIIKLGIYGIFRLIEFLSPADPIIGWSLVIVSMISAILGVWYALAQHDIKTLLAYHSVENIGIIGLGLGVGVLGVTYGNQAAAVLGFSGALLHTLNHALFKSQLFIGSGVIYQNLHTRDIEKMGGLIHYAPLLAVLFLIGSVAIAGIPPLNGFISEFLIYYGFFSSGYSPVFMLLCVVGLALIGGLAVACFAKVNGVMFLGTKRSEYRSFKVSFPEYLALGLPAAMCVVIGLFPQPFIDLVKGSIGQKALAGGMPVAPFMPDFMLISVIFVLLAAVSAALYLIKALLQKRSGRRVSIPWGCGYQRLDSRMQYTASSFADELTTIPANVLMLKKKLSAPEGIFPTKSSFHSHAEDFAESTVVVPVYKKVLEVTAKLSVFGKTDVRSYIAYILAALVVYSIIGFLWQ